MATYILACNYRLLCVYIKAPSPLPTELCGDVCGILYVYLKASVYNYT
jgi:hypothetical protein